ncbi:hypothetical protein TELCIR_19375, partial [Teladorsagia circumcincta]
NLKLRYVNDSRLVGLAIYNVAILSLVTGPVTTLLIRSQANSNFAFVAVTVLLCTYISLGLVFVPKMRFIRRVPPSADEKERRIRQCKERLERILNKEDDLLSISGAANNTRSVSGTTLKQ